MLGFLLACSDPTPAAQPVVDPEESPFGDANRGAELVVVGWGSTWGAIHGAVGRVNRAGRPVAHVHLGHLHPFPANLGEVLARFDKVLVPEMNLGQLCNLLRAEFLIDVHGINKMQGQPFGVQELVGRVKAAIDEWNQRAEA